MCHQRADYWQRLVWGVSLPLEGFAACNLGGGIVDKSAATGPLAAQQYVSATVANGSFTGQAQASAAYGRLGVAANGIMTGATSPFTYHQTAGFARFQDTLTLTSPGIATGTPGAVDFAVLVEGMMNSVANAPYTQQGDIALMIRTGPGVGNPAAGPWTVFAGTVVGEGMPFLRGGATGIPGDFIVGPGTFSGSATVQSIANFNMQWGVPLDIEVAFQASVYPCCNGAASLDASFSNTALLSGISAKAGGTAVADFSVLSESGTAYGPGGLLPVPEPGPIALWSGGLALLGAVRWRQRSARAAP